jgi:hypothetical protein
LEREIKRYNFKTDRQVLSFGEDLGEALAFINLFNYNYIYKTDLGITGIYDLNLFKA